MIKIHNRLIFVWFLFAIVFYFNQYEYFWVNMQENNNHNQKKSLDVARTNMANERTFLSYVRTSLASLVVGGSSMHLSNGQILMESLGATFAVLSGVIFLVGYLRFHKAQNLVAQNDPNIIGDNSED